MTMNRVSFIQYIFSFGFSFSGFPGILNPFKNNLPNILLLGDSISIGYTPFVREIMKEKANIYRAINGNDKPENCLGTINGVQNIERWLGIKDWSIIHFNFGLHDVKHVDPLSGKNSVNPKDPLQCDLKNYVKNLEFIIDKLRTTNAKLIFATTTPVPNLSVNPLREPQTVVSYNNAALKIMKRERILVNDLYAFAIPILSEIQRPDNVHFTVEGYRLLAEQVSNKIMNYL